MRLRGWCGPKPPTTLPWPSMLLKRPELPAVPCETKTQVSQREKPKPPAHSPWPATLPLTLAGRLTCPNTIQLWGMGCGMGWGEVEQGGMGWGGAGCGAHDPEK